MFNNSLPPYTVALTSCGRFDLLERTLVSLLPRLEGPCERIIIGEDSGDRRIMEMATRFRSPPVDIIRNRFRLGIKRNIDRIYEKVETEWIFHCEDDWEFYRAGFIRESFSIMQNDTISSVSLRDISDFESGFWNPAHDGDHYVSNQDVAGEFAGLQFNPGLRRMSDYLAIGPYGNLPSGWSEEADVSMAYSSAGKRMALLRSPAVRHIGDGRHVGRSRKLADRMARRVRKLRARLVQ